MRDAACALIACTLLPGCYEASTPRIDAGPPVDAPMDAPCAPVGDLLRCSDECGGWATCRDDPAHDYVDCNGVVCILGPAVAPGCGVSVTVPLSGTFGPLGDTACLRDPRFGGLGGSAVSDSLCPGLEAIGLECFWSDGSDYTRSPPPAETCPWTAGSTPLCGGACGDCMALGSTFDAQCIGRNDDRDLGVCTVVNGVLGGGNECGPELPAGERIGGLAYVQVGWYDWDGTDPPTTYSVCLRLRLADGTLSPHGYVAPSTGCLLYRSLFPGDVECMDDSWTPLP